MFSQFQSLKHGYVRANHCLLLVHQSMRSLHQHQARLMMSCVSSSSFCSHLNHSSTKILYLELYKPSTQTTNSRQCWAGRCLHQLFAPMRAHRELLKLECGQTSCWITLIYFFKHFRTLSETKEFSSEFDSGSDLNISDDSKDQQVR